MGDLPYTEFGATVPRSHTCAHGVGVAGLLAMVGATVMLSVASSQRAAAQASAARLEQVLPRLEALVATSADTGSASPMASKFALDSVTPTDFQMNRGDCWLFATVGILEDSYHRQGVARGWLARDEYVHLSRQAFGVGVLDACLKHRTACAFDGDSIYTGNSTTGGEIELIYYLPEVGARALPWSVCEYVPTPTADRKCDGREAALRSNPLQFHVRSLQTLYNRMDIKAALARSNRALGLSTPMVVVPYLLPCTAETAATLRCDPSDTAKCVACPLERAYEGVGCCVAVSRPQYNLKAEWFHRPGEALLKEGGHSVALVGWNDHYRTEQGLQGGWIIRNSWEDGLGLSHGAPIRGSRSLGWFMQRHSDLDEATVCPNTRDPRAWYPCLDLQSCRDAQTVLFAKTARKVLQLECIDTGFYVAGACAKGERLYLKDQGGGYGLTPWGGGLTVACFVRASDGGSFCLPPLPVDDLGTIVQPVAGEDVPNRKDLCGFYFVPYETLEAMEAALGGVWVSDLDIEWDAESYAIHEAAGKAKGKDYALLKANTHKLRPAAFSGPLPHLTVPQ